MQAKHQKNYLLVSGFCGFCVRLIGYSKFAGKTPLHEHKGVVRRLRVMGWWRLKGNQTLNASTRKAIKKQKSLVK